MKSFGHIITLIYVIIFVISVAITCTSSAYFEPRTKREQILTEGIIPMNLFALPFLLIVIYGLYLLFIQKEILLGIIMSICGYFAVSFLGFFLAFGYGEIGVFKKDRIIYHLPNDTTQKIILQYYETGVTGNERYRLIETSDIDASLRPMREIFSEDSIISIIKIGCLHYGCSEMDTTKVPKIIEYNKKDYVFERVNAD